MKKGQAAMEFLMSYGWALIVIFIAISALAYFGVLNPRGNLPETCIFFPGISCEDIKIDSESVSLIITNGGGIDLVNVSFSVLGDGPCEGDISNIESLGDGNRKTFVIECTNRPISGSAFRRDIQISYTEYEGLQHSKKGQINTKVE